MKTSAKTTASILRYLEAIWSGEQDAQLVTVIFEIYFEMKERK